MYSIFYFSLFTTAVGCGQIIFTSLLVYCLHDMWVQYLVGSKFQQRNHLSRVAFFHPRMRHGETLGTNPTPVPRLPNPLRPHLPQSCASLSPHHSSRSLSSPVNPGRLRRAPASTTTSQHPRQGGSRAGRQWPAREGSDGQQDWESTGTSRGERATTSEGTCPRWSTPPLLSQVILAALLLSQVIPAPLLLSQDPGFLLFFSL